MNRTKREQMCIGAIRITAYINTAFTLIHFTVYRYTRILESSNPQTMSDASKVVIIHLWQPLFLLRSE
jgi:hypothetical protein